MTKRIPPDSGHGGVVGIEPDFVHMIGQRPRKCSWMVNGNITVIQGSSRIPPILGVMNGMRAAFINKEWNKIMTLCKKRDIT